MYISLLLKMINGFSWSAKIIASPFKFTVYVKEKLHPKPKLAMFFTEKKKI